MTMAKRKRPYEDHSEAEASSQGFSEAALSEDEVDITSALSGKKPKIEKAKIDSDDDGDIYDDLQNIIKEAVQKRDKKDGTKMLKMTKGKGKMSKGEVGGGSFQSMGLHPSLLRSLTLRGYKVPTPIQRLSIPTLLASPPRDLVGMARTGSGKTLAYMVPLVQRLGGRHATTFGARALILVPARELAVQVLKVGKELARGWTAGDGGHAGDNEDDEEGTGKGQNMRWGLIVGGEGLDEQFEMITSNPDVIIATPGRLLHLIVEMNLDLRSVQYVVFDEADRLFEMGFAIALNEILHRLPSSRQTLLFSATLPKSLVEFAKAGLQEPKLVRLDAESKISSDLRMAFFSLKQAEKDECLLILLRDVIQVPLGTPKGDDENDKSRGDNEKEKDNKLHAEPHQTLVFVATKHHVEYVSNLLTTAGYAVSHIYGSLDQSARTEQMDNFRRGRTRVLVVTDVAARGIDIPVLAHVVNFDFPHGARVFVHRVGRTARAGRTGWAWSLVAAAELPHMLDLQLFLGRPLQSTAEGAGERPYVESLVLGAFPRNKIDDETEYVRSLDEENQALPTLREVMRKGHGLYERSQGKASQASYKRAKDMMRSGKWGFSTSVGETTVHPVFRLFQGTAEDERANKEEDARKALLRAVNSFTPAETVFEAGTKGKATSSALMKDRRKALVKARERAVPSTSVVEDQKLEDEAIPSVDVEMANEDDIEAAFASSSKHGKQNFRDSEFFMSHFQKNAMTEKGYSLKDGASFAEQARTATFELAGDDGGRTGATRQAQSQLKWDRKKKNFVRGDGAGADNVKIVKTEGGTRLPASYRSGRFDEWKAKTRRELPRVGEKEGDGVRSTGARGGGGGKRFKHQGATPAKPLDKLSTDYERKVRQIKKREQEKVGGNVPETASRPGGASRGGKSAVGKKGGKGARGLGRYGGKPIGKVKSELKSVDQIRKSREIVERKRARNARPSRGKGKGRR